MTANTQPGRRTAHLFPTHGRVELVRGLRGARLRRDLHPSQPSFMPFPTHPVLVRLMLDALRYIPARRGVVLLNVLVPAFERQFWYRGCFFTCHNRTGTPHPPHRLLRQPATPPCELPYYTRATPFRHQPTTSPTRFGWFALGGTVGGFLPAG